MTIIAENERLLEMTVDPDTTWAIIHTESEHTDTRSPSVIYRIEGTHVIPVVYPPAIITIIDVITRLRPIMMFPDIRDLIAIGDAHRVVVTLPTARLDAAHPRDVKFHDGGVQILMPRRDMNTFALRRHIYTLSRVGVVVPSTTSYVELAKSQVSL